MASNPRAKAQRENAARVREFRQTREYQTALPTSFKTEYHGARLEHMRELVDKFERDPNSLTTADKKELGSMSSRGAHGQKGYDEFDRPDLETEDFWYHVKGKGK